MKAIIFALPAILISSVQARPIPDVVQAVTKSSNGNKITITKLNSAGVPVVQITYYASSSTNAESDLKVADGSTGSTGSLGASNTQEHTEAGGESVKVNKNGGKTIKDTQSTSDLQETVTYLTDGQAAAQGIVFDDGNDAIANSASSGSSSKQVVKFDTNGNPTTTRTVTFQQKATSVSAQGKGFAKATTHVTVEGGDHGVKVSSSSGSDASAGNISGAKVGSSVSGSTSGKDATSESDGKVTGNASNDRSGKLQTDSSLSGKSSATSGGGEVTSSGSLAADSSSKGSTSDDQINGSVASSADGSIKGDNYAYSVNIGAATQGKGIGSNDYTSTRRPPPGSDYNNPGGHIDSEVATTESDVFEYTTDPNGRVTGATVGSVSVGNGHAGASAGGTAGDTKAGHSVNTSSGDTSKGVSAAAGTSNQAKGSASTNSLGVDYNNNGGPNFDVYDRVSNSASSSQSTGEETYDSSVAQVHDGGKASSSGFAGTGNGSSRSSAFGDSKLGGAAEAVGNTEHSTDGASSTMVTTTNRKATGSTASNNGSGTSSISEGSAGSSGNAFGGASAQSGSGLGSHSHHSGSSSNVATESDVIAGGRDGTTSADSISTSNKDGVVSGQSGSVPLGSTPNTPATSQDASSSLGSHSGAHAGGAASSGSQRTGYKQKSSFHGS